MGRRLIEFRDDIIEDEPFEATADDLQLAFVADQFVWLGAAEVGELGSLAVFSNDRGEDGLGHDAFDDLDTPGQRRQAKRGFGIGFGSGVHSARILSLAARMWIVKWLAVVSGCFVQLLFDSIVWRGRQGNSGGKVGRVRQKADRRNRMGNELPILPGVVVWDLSAGKEVAHSLLVVNWRAWRSVLWLIGVAHGVLFADNYC